MILYYAMGGGLGHLTRARAFLHTLAVEEAVTVMTAHPAERVRRICGPVDVVSPDPSMARDVAAYRSWLCTTFDRLRPSALYLDAFPAGLFGEFCDFPLPTGMRCYHLARLLRWPVYAARLKGRVPVFEKVFRLEPLTARHERFLAKHAGSLEDLTLHDPPHPIPPGLCRKLERQQRSGRPLWIVVHAGAPAEVERLLRYAEELALNEKTLPHVWLVSPHRPANLGAPVRHLDVYPAHPLFPHADRIITAGGFNAMRQAAPWSDKHRCLPFPRPLDDQFARVARGGGVFSC